MMNINCSENCSHEKNGKCTLSHVGISASTMGYGSDCAYYNPRSNISNAPPEKK